MSDFKALLKQQEKFQRKKIRPKRGPRVRNPREIERRLQRDLRPMLIKLQELVLTRTMPRIKNIFNQLQHERPTNLKADIGDDDIFDVFGELKVQVTDVFDRNEIADIISKSSRALTAINEKNLAKGLKRITGVDILLDEPYLDNELRLHNQNNVQLIQKMSQESVGKVESRIYEGLRSGERYESIEKDIKNLINPKTGDPAKRAKLIARDQSSKLNAQVTMLRQQELGVTHYIWRTSGDGNRVRKTHRAHNGKKFAWARPPAKTGHPGEDVNCRCIAEPVLDNLL